MLQTKFFLMRTRHFSETNEQLLQRLLFCFLMIIFSSSWSISLVLPEKGDLVGEIQSTRPEIGETLSDVAIRYDIGYYEMMRANPRVDPVRPLSPEVRLIIPSHFILPPGPREGLVINLAEYRLYYYPPNDNVVITMPVGIGREGWTTPVGMTKVIAKERDPVWRPTANVRAEAAKNGIPIPDTFPPGEGNPLGRHILRLGWPTYLIHGTNRRDGVGSRVSAGCIRMMPEDIEYLFDLVTVGTPVRVLNEPIKLGRHKGAIYMQVHPPLIEQKNSNLHQLIEQQLTKMEVTKINAKVVQGEENYPTGIPQKIS
ncbi:L,D-transpeptidase family protein [Legionella sp.]|uniref:Putative ErfK/YbiS/YcfS/YnhG family protein n=2 Tax=Legionella maceachernii TaxID=466 RepID=A0A0W0WEJ2_9GAMM|nr:putative ErfK/YbiS/YcfS/YnhG family protein precursor [Legionella maceachernii]SJZ69472.1 L,D-transpeptidase ErfK/SrfK [Legionella maceachernii]SUP02208.1 Probable L,D-transpeptidase YnhG precursor [Legionella maceachernii]